MQLVLSICFILEPVLWANDPYRIGFRCLETVYKYNLQLELSFPQLNISICFISSVKPSSRVKGSHVAIRSAGHHRLDDSAVGAKRNLVLFRCPTRDHHNMLRKSIGEPRTLVKQAAKVINRGYGKTKSELNCKKCIHFWLRCIDGFQLEQSDVMSNCNVLIDRWSSC